MSDGQSMDESFAGEGVPDVPVKNLEDVHKKDPMHPNVRALLKHFSYGHLPVELQAISRPACEMAEYMADHLDGPELTVGLRKLLEAKDCFVRAALAKESA